MLDATGSHLTSPATELGGGAASEQTTVSELVQLCALDSRLFNKTFFPKAFRQEPPLFDEALSRFLEGPGRLKMCHIFRGGMKTTRLRALTAKRIAYGVSRTVLYIGKSEGHAIRSVGWLRSQVEHNRNFADTFGLRPGVKWQDHEAQIHHGVDEVPIWVVGMGVHGSVRGINLDDYRPDLIILDDIISEENSGTPEQREKINDLVYGALLESLAPASEAPDAMIAGLQTPIANDDYSMKAKSDPSWKYFRAGCWTPETEELPLHQRESVWPARWSSETLRQEKLDAIARNKLSAFVREKECKLITPETSAFLPSWVQRWQELPQSLSHIMVIDPVPPPSPAAIAKGMDKKDFEAISVLGRGPKGQIYVREISVSKGHEPSWTLMEFFRLARKYRIRKVVVESVAYQRTLAWLLRQAMMTERLYFVIEEFDDRRSKHNRILDGISGPASQHMLFLPPLHLPEANSEGIQMFLQQFAEYPNVSHDDALETVAIGCMKLQGLLFGDSEDDVLPDEDDEYAKAPKGEIGRTLSP
jgi:hypothetical protein